MVCRVAWGLARVRMQHVCAKLELVEVGLTLLPVLVRETQATLFVHVRFIETDAAL